MTICFPRDTRTQMV